MTYRISTDELLADLQQVAKTVEETPTISQYNDLGKYSSDTQKSRFGSWNRAIEAAGYTPNVVSSLTQQELLDDLQQTADKLGSVPTTADQNAHGNFCPQTFKNKFGSWNQAIKQAGYEPNLRKDITDEELLEDLRRVGDALRSSPTVADYDSEGKFSRKTVTKRFDSWNQALKQAGFRLNKEAPCEDLVADLKEVGRSLGRVPTVEDYRRHGKYSTTLISERFGSWNKALDEAEYSINKRHNIPREELLEDLEQVNKLLSGPPTMGEYNLKGKFSTGPFLNLFGSWNDALEAAGFEPNRRRDISDSELLENLKHVAASINKPPTIVEYELHGDYSPSTLSNSFDTWNKALREAGYQPNTIRDISTEVLLSNLQHVGNLIESVPTIVDYDVYGEYGSATLSHKFGSWNSALKEAGYQPNLRRDIPDEELLADLQHIAEIVDKTPTVENYREYGEFSVKVLEERFGSWNNALKEVGLSLNTHIPSGDLLSDLSKCGDGVLAPSRNVYNRSGTYHSGTVRSNLSSWWTACVKAGFKPLARRPLCPKASNLYHQTAINLQRGDLSFYALLFQFTGLSPEIAVHLSVDWIADRRHRCIIRVPREYTVTGSSWVFRVPEVWTNPDTGNKEPTHLPKAIDWYTTNYPEVPLQSYGTLQKIPRRIAQRAGLDRFRRSTDHSSLGTVPEVRPQDLRATLGVNLAREGISREEIRTQVGINQTAWQADVDDFFCWLHEREGYQHPEYTPVDE